MIDPKYLNYLDPDLVIGVFRAELENGACLPTSCQRVAQRLAEDLEIEGRSGAPTRQGVHYVMKQSEEGLALLELNKRRLRGERVKLVDVGL